MARSAGWLEAAPVDKCESLLCHAAHGAHGAAPKGWELRDIEEYPAETATIGERLLAAREERGLSLADVARTTRIPIRHLEHMERGEWEELPAVTYSIGFARSYANAVGLDGPSISAELREQLGNAQRAAAPPIYYEAADPSRVPPKPLAIIAALVAVLLVIGYVVWRSGAVDDTEVADVQSQGEPAPAAPPESVPANPANPAQTAPNPNGPVVLNATADVWIRVFEAEGGAKLYEGELKAGQRYEVPATARAPQIRTGLAEALQVTVGGQAVPPLGPPSTTIRNASLRAADLLATRAAPTTATPQP
jgi:cytoskeleton protein RodZ